jgi:anti-anti-sigma regulatory factor
MSSMTSMIRVTMQTLPRSVHRFTAEQFGETIIIRLQRRALDSRFSRRDRRCVEMLLTRHPRLILDLAEVATTNGTGLEMIADWVSCADSAGNSLVLAHCSRQILALMKILGISRIARVASSLTDAFECFQAGRS